MTWVPDAEVLAELEMQARSCAKCGACVLSIERLTRRPPHWWYIVTCMLCGGWKRSCALSPHLAIAAWNAENDREESTP